MRFLETISLHEEWKKCFDSPQSYKSVDELCSEWTCGWVSVLAIKQNKKVITARWHHRYVVK